MKLIFTTICLLLFTSIVSAQTEKGKFLIGAQSGLSFSSMDKEYKSDSEDRDWGTERNFEFKPQFGFFIINNLVIGGEIPVSFFKYENGGYEFKSKRMAFVPFARYYFGKTNLKPYLHGGFGLGVLNEKSASSEDDYNLYTLELGGGMAIFIYDNIAVDIGLGYNSNTLKPKDNNDYEEKIITSGLTLQVGFSVFI